MANTTVPVKTASNHTIFVEVIDDGSPPTASPGMTGFGLGALPPGTELTGAKEVLTKTVDAFGRLRETIRQVIVETAGGLENLGPEEWSIEFGISFKGKTDFIPVIVSSEAGASIKISAKWKKAPHDKGEKEKDGEGTRDS